MRERPPNPVSCRRHATPSYRPVDTPTIEYAEPSPISRGTVFPIAVMEFG